ncbi:ABC transporter permease [Enterococcus gilvus]|uniref:ABC transporter permease n=1 Tax=Enterococcus gilvus TaxID=160453 RepID=UPI003D6B44E2
MRQFYLQRAKRILHYRSSYKLAFVILALISSVSLLILVLPFDPNQSNIEQLSQFPSLRHPFGTDELGRDYFLRVLHGGHVSLFVGFTAMLVSTLIGTTTGLIAGYFGGRLDNLLMRIVDIFSSVPWMILTVVLSVLLKPGMSTIILVISLFSWMNIARLVRAETLTVKERDFVFYSEFIGVPVTTILIKHISPQIISVITVAAISNLSNAIMMESALSFLGLGIQQPQSSWGSLLESAQSSLQEAPYMAITPGILITVTVLCCNQLASFFQLVFSNEG